MRACVRVCALPVQIILIMNTHFVTFFLRQVTRNIENDQEKYTWHDGTHHKKKQRNDLKKLCLNVCSSFLVMVREGTIGGTGPEADDMGDGAEGELSG